jgi:tetratricopeptide (TPR) repeat protein
MGYVRKFTSSWLSCTGVVSFLLALLLTGCNGSGSAPKTSNTAGNLSNDASAFVAPDELLELNNQGIAYMEQFDDGGGYPRAIKVFEEIVRRWPAWTPGKFNLAVAHLNHNNKEDTERLSRVRRLLEEILSTDGQNARAHYTLGFLLQYEGKMEEALPHFEKVCLSLAPTDAMSWMRLGDCLDAASPAGDSRAASGESVLTPEKCYAKALELNPNLPAAYYKMSMNLVREGKLDEATKLRERFSALSQGLHDPYANDYIWSGPLAEAIGAKLPPPRPNERPLPVFSAAATEFVLAESVHWASTDDLLQSSNGALLTRIRNRFGAGVAAFDLDKDEDLDLFLPTSTVVGGQLRDTLLRNEGKGRFVDVTAELGLAQARESVGCAIGDFDADGLPDLYITALGGNHLFRNGAGSGFEDVTERAGVAETGRLSASALFLDVDHDGDLDLVVANYGPIEQADQMFQQQPYTGGTQNSLFLNVGKARPVDKGTPDQPPLEVQFARSTTQNDPWGHTTATVGFAAADFDNDRDLDLMEINDNTACRLLINHRVGKWTAQELPKATIPHARYNGALVADFNADLKIDLLLPSPDGPPVYLQNDLAQGQADRLPGFKPVTTDLRGLRAAQVADADFDGWWDVVALSSDLPSIVLAGNTARGILARPEWLSGLLDPRTPPQGVLVADFNGAEWPQLLVLHPAQSPSLWRTAGNGNQWLAIRATGHRKVASYSSKQPRSNPDGLGTRAIVHSGPNTVVWEDTCPTAGLCQNRLPYTVGLSARTTADAVRLRWSDGLEQAELNLPAGKTITLDETARRGDSCPLLFAWNGQSFQFVTDILGGGGLGYMIAPGVYSVPDPDEDVSIDPRSLVADEHGRLLLKIAEPMDEMTYLDAAWLEVIDHASDVTVFADERFNPDGAHPSGGRVAFRDRMFPISARDHRLRDVRERILQWDRRTVDEFARSSRWIGYAENHHVDLDFGNTFQGMKDEDPIALCLAGWIEYPYSQTNWAASTAGVNLEPPVLKWLNGQGEWEPLVASMGYPAGLPRMMTLDLTGKLPAVVRGTSGHEALPCRLRIETNMEIYWDQIFAAPLEPASTLRRTLLKPARAELGYRGYLQEYTPDGHEPKLFDYHQIISVPLVGLEGARTPYGSVRDLVLEQDEQFALINAGDEVTLAFDSHELPPLLSGWKRSYVLRSFGYCKGTDLFNQFDRTVDPLPGRGSSHEAAGYQTSR